MGFMDKAKKMAEQAQTKLDDVQKQFNENQDTQGTPPAQGGPVPQYDAHGRPVRPDTEAPPAPSAPPAPPTQPHGDPPETAAPPAATAPPAPPAAEGTDRQDEYAPPKLSSGDPLAG